MKKLEILIRKAKDRAILRGHTPSIFTWHSSNAASGECKKCGCMMYVNVLNPDEIYGNALHYDCKGTPHP